MRRHSIKLSCVVFLLRYILQNSTSLIFSFSGPNRILPLIPFRINIGPYDICYGYICYFDKFDRNGMYSTIAKELSFSLFMCFRIFNVGQIKMIFREDETLKKIFIANVYVYRYSNLIKLIRF